MARLSRKNPQILNELPQGWQSREGLVSLLVDSYRSSMISFLDPSRSSIGIKSEATPEVFMRSLFLRGSWQLSDPGVGFFYSSFRSWQVEHEDNLNMTGRVLLNIGRILNGPWYHQGRYIYVWNEGSHFEMQMVDGSCRRFVDLYLPK